LKKLLYPRLGQVDYSHVVLQIADNPGETLVTYSGPVTWDDGAVPSRRCFARRALSQVPTRSPAERRVHRADGRVIKKISRKASCTQSRYSLIADGLVLVALEQPASAVDQRPAYGSVTGVPQCLGGHVDEDPRGGCPSRADDQGTTGY
jgi:hypothetical protein